jgi:RHS repeat-associated protein
MRSPRATTFSRLRLAAPGLSTTVLVSFVATLMSPLTALAAPEPGDAPPEVHVNVVVGEPATPTPAKVATGEPGKGATPPPSTPIALDLPTGGDHTGVSSQSTSVPSGAGKIQGMGESFSAQLSTGIGTFSVPIQLPAARGAASPSLGLSYSSSGGHGIAGVGWDIGVPSIQRQTDRGIPRYDDQATWHAAQDRFVFNGGQELIPIGTVSGESCPGALPDEAFPTWANGWQYFRPRVEGGFLRFFWSSDHATWRVQDKSGVLMELGGDPNSLESDPSHPTHIFKWNLSKQSDVHTTAGAPLNPVVYQYTHDGGMAYLSDIYDTPPVQNPQAPFDAWAHHTRLRYETRTDPTVSYRRGWAATQTLRLVGIDVTSKAFKGAATPRKLVRRYHFDYDKAFHPSLLTQVQLEGRCEVPDTTPGAATIEVAQPVVEDATGGLPSTTSCPRLPPMSFGYTHVTPHHADGSAASADLVGYEGFDERVTSIAGSPKYSIDDGKTGFFDLNADALPDVLVTYPADFKGFFGAFMNGKGGKANTLSEDCVFVQGVNGDDAGSLSFQNPNLAPLDVDGDGRVDFLHMPKVKTYAVYTPTASTGSCGIALKGHSVVTASQQAPKIDFSTDAQDLRVMDVNGDGLVDVVLSQGKEYQTYFALGRYPQGYTQFGNAAWTSGTTSQISNEPVTRCVPWAGTPVKFSDPDVRVGDMNGDGYPDIVRIRPGELKYWPGRGDGTWGTGALDCAAGNFGQGRDVQMAASPWYSDVTNGGIRLDDVNGDGLDDLVQVRFDGIDIWLNVDGVGFTPSRHILDSTPVSPAFQSRVRLLDINGSGTRDIVWGDGGGYKYIDLQGSVQPWLLNHVANGLGKTTEIEYASSPQLMLEAEAAGKPWSSVMPMPIHVVSKTTERDNLAIVGRPAGEYLTTYEYRDPVYEGRQREFRGFRNVKVRRVGDDNSPSATTESTFLLGECVPTDGNDECTYANAWMDNPREALKGLPVVSESYSDAGIYLSTTHHQYRLRKLYTGLDGRAVRYAYETGTDAFSYDTGPFSLGSATTPLQDVTIQDLDGNVTAEPTYTRPVPVRSAKRVLIQGSSEVDLFGNATVKVALGCTQGCATPDEAITSHTVPARAPGDATGWLWRTTESWVVGSLHPDEHKHTITQYDALGRPVDTFAKFDGELELKRSNPSGGGIAPAPAGATGYGTQWVSHTDYDTFGNVQAQRSAGGRCRTMGYDDAFNDLVTTETVLVGPVDPAAPPMSQCGPTPLTSQVETYDRGFGAATLVRDIHKEATATSYDGFGRLTAVYKPHPTIIGALSPAPSVLIDYALTTDPIGRPYSTLHTRTTDGVDEADSSSYIESYAYVDGMGRTIVTLQEADPDPLQDGHQWIVNGLTEYDNKGAARRAYLAWFWDGDPLQYPLAQPASSPYGRQRYDAFGRQVETVGLDGTITLKSVYHALSKDLWDAADLATGPHQGTYASEAMDGHGRGVSVTERTHIAGGMIEARETRKTYLPSGPVETITRVRGKDSVTRWMRYDTQDRMVLNVEPNVTKGFSPDPSTPADSMQAWRYAYNDAGDLVGTSDARGCGSNFHYDGAGRLLFEDYSPCKSNHRPYSAEAEVAYRYDSPDPDSPPDGDAKAPAPGTLHIDGFLLLGRLVSVSDRASKTVSSYDGRGRVLGVGRKVAAPDGTGYTPTWYTSYTTYDGADRPIDDSTGAATDKLQVGGKSLVSTAYTARGLLKRVDSSYGTLVGNVRHDADGLVGQIEYGDLAKTTTAYTYDNRRRVHSVQTYRGPPDAWKADPYPDTQQTLLEDLDYSYDVVDNATEVTDWRIASEWLPGAKPVSRSVVYDDLYRVSKVDYHYAAGTDTWVDPFEGDDLSHDQPHPSPRQSFGNRILQQTFSYDWLGNTNHTDDDAHGFYDRSLGSVTQDGAKPYQLKHAEQPGPNGGSLDATYDEAGNLTALNVTRLGPCLGGSCTQAFRYEWDEVGRLDHAQRWDGTTTPSSAPASELSYAYDAHDQRVRKTAVDGVGSVPLHTVYVLDSLELRRAMYAGGDYQRDLTTERVYLLAHGVRLARLGYHQASTVPTVTDGLHVFLEMGDHLGSTAVVIDKGTSEVVEAGTYTAYGSAESDYRPARWGSFREDYRFTGKEEDSEVGLTYFGKRFMSPYLGRWVSADPLAIHGGAADSNAYAYVRGRLLRSTDPLGLEDKPAWYSPSGWLGQKLVHSDNVIAEWAQNEKNLDTAMKVSAGTAIVAATVATGGLAATWGAGIATSAGAGAGTATLVGGVTGGAAAGIVARSSTTSLATGGDVKATLKAATDPVALLQDAATGGVVAGAPALVEAAKPVVRRVTSALTGGGKPPVVGAAPKAPTPVAPEAASPKPAPCGGGTCGADPTCFVAGTAVRTDSASVPIEQVRVGARVAGKCDPTSFDDSWSVITAQLTSLSGQISTVQLLRSREWVEFHDMRPGVYRWLELEDTDVGGWADILDVRSAGGDPGGEGCIVLLTVRHVSAQLVVLRVDGDATALEVTPGHHVRSVSRGWVEAGDLEVGEELATETGSARLVSIARVSGGREVFNLEVAGSHSYFVGDIGVWVHNTCPTPTQVVKDTGSYRNTHASGKVYIGKGSRARSQASGEREAVANNDPHVATEWRPATSHREAFKEESRMLDAEGGAASPSNYNRIESPGKKMRIDDKTP